MDNSKVVLTSTENIEKLKNQAQSMNAQTMPDADSVGNMYPNIYSPMFQTMPQHTMPFYPPNHTVAHQTMSPSYAPMPHLTNSQSNKFSNSHMVQPMPFMVPVPINHVQNANPQITSAMPSRIEFPMMSTQIPTPLMGMVRISYPPMQKNINGTTSPIRTQPTANAQIVSSKDGPTFVPASIVSL